MSESCVLDVVDENPEGLTLTETAERIGYVSRERVRQMQYESYDRLCRKLHRLGLDLYFLGAERPERGDT